MNRVVRVLVLDARTVERKGLSSLLNAMPSLAVVGEASTVQEAMVMLKTSHPDVVLINNDVVHQEGEDSVRRICRECAGAVVFILFSDATVGSSHIEIESGKIWFVANDVAPDELVESIERIFCQGA